jgi:hypothetical protein
VAHTCNPNYPEVEIGRFKAIQDKKLARPPSQQKKSDMIARSHSPSCVGGIGRQIVVQGWPGQKSGDPI